MSIHNPEIARLLERYALLLEIDRANPFRVRAYRNAARVVENLPRDVTAMLEEGADLSELPGIGKDLAHKLEQICSTGKFAELRDIEKRVPAALADLAEVPGLGPKRVKLLFETLKIKSMAGLAEAARRGRLHELPGFGAKLEQTILKASEAHVSGAEQRVRLFAAEQIAIPLVKYLESFKGMEKVIVAGSYRRRKESVGDLDILAICAKGAEAIGHFVRYNEVASVLAEGTTRATVKLKSGLQVDLRVVPAKSYGAALLYFTGSKAHNINLRQMGVKRGLKINEYGVFRKEEWLAGHTEKDVYAQLDLPYIEPELRENTGEIEAAKAGKLPRLVALKDIKGDLHVHTNASDGNATLEEMAEAARARGYEYLAISDHTKHVGITHGLDEKRLARQMNTIDRLNARSRGFRILKSAEVDILPDGKLAMDDGMLAELDLVTAAIHTQFAGDQTKRLIRAMDNRHVHLIAHPTGRLIGERDAYAVDMRKVMEAALARGCYLEVNGQPSRLDLNDSHCKLAKEMGLKLALVTDAHSGDTLDYMRYAVDQARRGWLSPKDVLNTRNWADLARLLKRK
ncbi:MAG TPA: DNA polymerase/3'-5' exonuclease PolX [Rhizomicrobium sp.]|nr:DNA polymerase/3'-5' exonuclease PolX [Rhizomicrobium sp.]